MEINKELLKKIKALADSGSTPGERAAAARKLAQLLEQSGIDVSELLEEEPQFYHLVIKGRMTDIEFKLAVQVYGHIIDQSSKLRIHYYDKKRRKDLGYFATPLQHLRMQILFPHYLQAFRDQLEQFMTAFIHANHIFPETPGKKDDREDLTDEELENIARMLRMAQGIKPTPPPAPQLKA